MSPGEAIFRAVTRALMARMRQPPPSMAPPEGFEALCAEALRRQGWQARTTRASGDQGADVVADLEGRRVVLQVKLWTRPAGTKAVQEAYAAMAVYRATHAAVVCPAGYTPGAKQAARATGVHLLHHTDLARARSLFR